MDKIIKQKAHLYDMLKKEIGGGIMQVQNNVLDQLLAAHHPNKSFLEKIAIIIIMNAFLWQKYGQTRGM